MNDYAIITDSGCDLPAELAQALSVTVLPLTFRLGQRQFRNLLDGSDLTFEEFYLHLRGGIPCTTRALSVHECRAAALPVLQSGRDVLFLCLSSGLSAGWNAAQAACQQLAAEFPARTLRAVDSLSASLGLGLLVYFAAQRRRTGATLTEVADWLEQLRPRLRQWITVDDAHFLQRSGHLSSGTALLDTMLNKKPLLYLDRAGHLASAGKVHGRQAALDALVQHVIQEASGSENQVVFISHADARRDAALLARRLRQSSGIHKILINSIGPVVGAHTGPGTVAVFYLAAS